MKRCPKCDRTYTNDAQKFCTHDGGVLVTDVLPTVSFDPNATIITETPERSSPPPPPPVPPPVQDFNKTIASTIPPSPPPTSDFHRGETGPAIRPTSSNLPPSYSAGPAIPSSSSPQTPPYSPQPHASSPSPSMQTPAPPAQGAAGPQTTAAQPARKKSKLPLILGGLVVLVLLLAGVGAAIYFVVLPRVLAGINANSNSNSNTNATANSNTDSNINTSASPAENTNSQASANEEANANANANSSPEIASEDTNHSVAPFTPPPNSVAFVNSSATLDGKLAEHYVDFSFYYPRAWKADPKSGVAGASNFVKVERLLPPDYTQEQFAVAWYESGGTIETDRNKFPKLVETLNNNYRQFPEYRKVSEGDTRINSYDAHEFRFESVSRNTAKGDIKLWGRIVFLPPGKAGEKNGLILLMLATSLAPELNSISDVGAKGEMPLILDSFRFGKTQ
jgi:hypothetical protein